MEIKKGSIARSIAGHDKNNFFVVTETNGNYAYICDGKRRPVERQKKKKIKHLSPTNTVVDIDTAQTNRGVKKLLRLFLEQQV